MSTYSTSFELKPNFFLFSFSVSTHGIVSTNLIFPNFMNHNESNKRFINWDTFNAIEFSYGKLNFLHQLQMLEVTTWKWKGSLKIYFIFGICVRLSWKQAIAECYLDKEIKTLNIFSHYSRSIQTFFRQ